MLVNRSNINYTTIKHTVQEIYMRGFATEYDLLSLFCLIWVKTHFHCRTHSFILEGSLFSRLAESVILSKTKNSHITSAKSFALEFKPLDKSLMLIKNSKRSRH